MSYYCPNGHPFPSPVAVKCAECDAQVACEPAGKGMALDQLVSEFCVAVGEPVPLDAIERARALVAEVADLRHALRWALLLVPRPEEGNAGEYGEDYGGATRLAWPDDPENWL